MVSSCPGECFHPPGHFPLAPQKALLSWVLILDDFSKDSSLALTQVVLLALRVNEEHQKLITERVPIIDGPNPAPLATALCRPTYFTQPACSTHELSRIGARNEISLQLGILLIGQQLDDAPRERMGFKNNHRPLIRQWRSCVNGSGQPNARNHARRHWPSSGGEWPAGPASRALLCSAHHSL